MTIKDIAKHAGVSKSTVSRVLNNESGVSSEAKDKVEAVIKQFNYTPNRNAAMTRQKRKDVILVLTTRLDSHSESRLIRGMIEDANDNQEFLITETQFDIERTKQIVEENKNVSCLIIFAISGQDYKFVEDLYIPVVLIGQQIETTKHNYYFPDYISMEALVATNDCPKPVFLGYDANDMTMVNRYKAANNQFDFELEKFDVSSYGKLPKINIESVSQYQTFICATDSIALYAYKYILMAGIEEYEILSTGNNKQINFIIDNLQTVDFHYKAVGRYIINCLQNNIKVESDMNYTIVKS